MMRAMLKHTFTASIFLQIIQVSLSKVTISIELVSYSNPAGVQKGGRKCDPWPQDGCDHRFTICLDEYNGNKDDYNTCQYGSKTTDVFENSYNVVFTSHQTTLLDLEGHEMGVLLKVAVFDEDLRYDDFIDILFTQIALGSVNIPAKNRASAHYITKEIVGKEKTKLTIKYSTYCAQHYFRVPGTCTCEKYCEGLYDIDGHYRCDTNGNRICLQGWIDESTNCKTRFGICQPRTCMNGGICQSNRSCDCTEGYQGSTCSVDVDECAAGSTQYGVCDCENTMGCVNSVGSYTCVCKSGFSGKTCQGIETEKEATPTFESMTSKMASENGKTGLIAGLTVMVIIIILIVLFATIFLIKRHLKKSRDQNHTKSLETILQQRAHAEPADEAHDDPYIRDSTPRHGDFADTSVVVPSDETDQTLYSDATSTFPAINTQRDVPLSDISLCTEENPNNEGVSSSWV